MNSGQIDTYLNRLGLSDFHQKEDNRWIVSFPCDTSDIDSDIENFWVEIYLTNEWISFSSTILKSVYGRKLSEYYDLLFRLNHFINGFKFAITPDGEAILIQTERHVSVLDYEQFRGVFQQFLYFYLEWFPKLIESAAEDFNLKFRKSSRKKGDVDRLLSSFVDPDDSLAEAVLVLEDFGYPNIEVINLTKERDAEALEDIPEIHALLAQLLDRQQQILEAIRFVKEIDLSDFKDILPAQSSRKAVKAYPARKGRTTIVNVEGVTVGAVEGVRRVWRKRQISEEKARNLESDT